MLGVNHFNWIRFARLIASPWTFKKFQAGADPQTNWSSGADVSLPYLDPQAGSPSTLLDANGEPVLTRVESLSLWQGTAIKSEQSGKIVAITVPPGIADDRIFYWSENSVDDYYVKGAVLYQPAKMLYVDAPGSPLAFQPDEYSCSLIHS